MNHINYRSLMLIFAIILATIAGGCADQPSTQNNGPDYELSYGLVPPYLGVLSSPFDHMKPIHPPLFPVIRDERKEFNNIIVEADTISEDLDAKISLLKEEGKDVQRLETLLKEYKTLIAGAKMYQKLADQGDESCSDSECQTIEKTLYMQLSRESLKKSNSVLSEIFSEMKNLLPGHVVLDEDCTLAGNGTGRVVLAGDLEANISILNGILYIVDVPESPEHLEHPLNITGKYELKKSAKGENSLSYYTIVNATVDISAQRSAFIVEASEISITARGTGTVDLFGNGTYNITCPDGSSDKMQWELSTVRRTINSPYIYTGIR